MVEDRPADGRRQRRQDQAGGEAGARPADDDDGQADQHQRRPAPGQERQRGPESRDPVRAPAQQPVDRPPGSPPRGSCRGPTPAERSMTARQPNQQTPDPDGGPVAEGPVHAPGEDPPAEDRGDRRRPADHGGIRAARRGSGEPGRGWAAPRPARGRGPSSRRPAPAARPTRRPPGPAGPRPGRRPGRRPRGPRTPAPAPRAPAGRRSGRTAPARPGGPVRAGRPGPVRMRRHRGRINVHPPPPCGARSVARLRSISISDRSNVVDGLVFTMA